MRSLCFSRETPLSCSGLERPEDSRILTYSMFGLTCPPSEGLAALRTGKTTNGSENLPVPAEEAANRRLLVCGLFGSMLLKWSPALSKAAV